MPSQIISATEQTSLTTSTEQTAASSTASTTTVSATTQWINVGESHPVSYYVSLLKSSGTQPYVQLGWELQALPDATNATAVAKITYLALNATNPEVKEAFELMMKGGTPSPSDFTYPVPKHNTELQVLYWLACQNEFKKDDTLALAVAMVNGLWVTIGDRQVRQTVAKDVGELLSFFRETDQWMRGRGFHSLEDYPLEAKLCLSWTANVSPVWSHYPIKGYRTERLPIKAYLWNNVNVTTLQMMRTEASSKGWARSSSGESLDALEGYFYGIGGKSPHWERTDAVTEPMIIDGEIVTPQNFANVDFVYSYYLRTGKGVGVCSEEAAFLDAYLKAVGVASAFHSFWRFQRSDGQWISGHTHVVVYDAARGAWKSSERNVVDVWSDEIRFIFLSAVLRPPLIQRGYLRDNPLGPPIVGQVIVGAYYQLPYTTTSSEARTYFLSGLAAFQMKQWLLYT